MKMRIYASTKPGYSLPVDEAIQMGGHMANMCYMKGDFDSIITEPPDKTHERALSNIKNGHHSVFGHTSYTFIIEGLPKIVAMILNNEKDYETSEKSGRYTFMTPATDGIDEAEVDPGQASMPERNLYDKWFAIFKDLIHHEYPNINSKTVRNLALENARYFISVFTPATKMAHTLSLRQANYIIGFAEQFAAQETDDPFMLRLQPIMAELAKSLDELVGVEGLRDNKGRSFSLFAKRTRNPEWGETYCINYSGSFVHLAQALRHRTIWYEMRIPSLLQAQFFVPPIIRDDDLRAEYLADMKSIKHLYPLGMMVDINERGNVDAFLAKCQERLCGAAQLEICLRTKQNLEVYLGKAIEKLNTDLYSELINGYKTKCQLGYQTCTKPCPLGPNHAFDRLI